jgi:hypothetical protein
LTEDGTQHPDVEEDEAEFDSPDADRGPEGSEWGQNELQELTVFRLAGDENELSYTSTESAAGIP